MLANFEIPVIETYAELAGVVAGLAFVLLALRFLWRRRSRAARAGTRRPALKAASRPRKAAAAERHAKLVTSVDFDKLAAVISDANDRAGHISETQTAAALKLDTAEMQVNRLLAEIESLKTADTKSRATAAPVQATPTTTPLPLVPRSNIAA